MLILSVILQIQRVRKLPVDQRNAGGGPGKQGARATYGWAACSGSSSGRLGSTSSPEEAPRSRLLTQGAACTRAHRASIRRAASQPRYREAVTPWAGHGSRQSSSTGTPITSHARSATRR